MSDSLDFFNALRPKILELISLRTADCLRLAPYVVSVPPDPETGLIGVVRVVGAMECGEPKMMVNPPQYSGEGVQPEVNDMPVACQSRRVTEPQRDPSGVGGAQQFRSRMRVNASPVLYVPYHPSLSSASAGDHVLLVYRGNLSNAYALPTF